MRRFVRIVFVSALVAACGEPSDPADPADGAPPTDGARADAVADARPPDIGPEDPEVGPAIELDVGLRDGAMVELLPDVEMPPEAGAAEAGPPDAVGPDVMAPDAGSPDATPPDAALPELPVDGLVFELLFDGEGQIALDTSGNGYDGRLGRADGPDGADPLRVDGVVGPGLEFDGDDDVVQLAELRATPDVTVVAWLFSTADRDIDRIVVNTHNDELDVRVGEDGHFSASVGGQRIVDAAFRFKPPGDGFARWTHVGYTYDDASGVHHLYRDGAIVAERIAPARMVDTDRPLWIGRHSQFDFGTFAGRLDQVRLYDRALTPDEVDAIYTRERPAPAAPPDCDPDDGLAIYRRRVEPLVTGGQPATCNQCHLAGVQLGGFVRGDPCTSMACLVEQGLVDLDRPDESAILEQILLAEPDNALITDAVIRAEYAGFLEWIRFSAACGQAVCPPVDDPCPGGAPVPAPDERPGPLGACAEATLVDAFERQVFVSIGRCAGCHAVEGPQFQAGAPLFIAPGEDRAAARDTMYGLVGIGSIDVGDPLASLLLTKPLAEEAGGVPHGGGPKFRDLDDPSARSYVNWLEAYSACAETGEVPPGPDGPLVGILAPAPGAELDGPRVTLRGEAIDAQDGLLAGDAMVWRSDRVEGPIGAAAVVEGVRLPAGVHRVTLTATDSDGNAAEAAVDITVR